MIDEVEIYNKLKKIEPHIKVNKFSVGDKAKIACIVEKVNSRYYKNKQLSIVKHLFKDANVLTAVTYIMNNIEPDKHKALLIVEKFLEKKDYCIEY